MIEPILFACVVIILVLNFLQQSHAVLEADLVCNPRFSGNCIAHAVKYLVEYINLFLAQRIFKGDTER